MGQKIAPEKPSNKVEQKDIIFIYDLKSTVKHFLAGTSVVSDVNTLTRYDDYDLIQHKRGIEIKSLTFYKEDNKIIGFQIVYKDTDKKELTLERIAPKYKKSKNKIAYKLKLAYNEHLADIDIVYNYDHIKYIEIITSKGSYLKTGKEENSEKEGRENILYTSISKVDVLQKSYMPIIAFETTFSKDALKELFIYRAPVRFSKKRKRTALTVSEINSLKAAPNLDSLKKAKRNIELIRNVTMKSIRQLKALKTFQALAQKPETTKNDASFGNLQGTTQNIKEEKQEKDDKYMEEQEFGIDNEEDKERKAEMEELQKDSAAKKTPGNLLINLFKGRDSSGQSNKDTPSNQNSPAASSASRSKKALKIFSILRFDSLKKIMGVNTPDKKPKAKPGITQNLARILPQNDSQTKRSSKENSVTHKSPLNPSLFKKQQTIEDALRNFDSADESHLSPEKDSSKSFQKSAFGLRFNQRNLNRSSFDSNLTPAKDKDDDLSLSPSKVEKEETVQTPSSNSDDDIQTFSHAMQRYESVQPPIDMKPILDLKTAGKRFSEASSIQPNVRTSVQSRGSSFFGGGKSGKSSPVKTVRSDMKPPQNQERSILDLFTNKKSRVSEPHVTQSPLDSAILKLYGKDPDNVPEPTVDFTKAPIRRSRIYSEAQTGSRRSSIFSKEILFGNK